MLVVSVYKGENMSKIYTFLILILVVPSIAISGVAENDHVNLGTLCPECQ